MTLTIPDDLLRASGLTEKEMCLELALALFRAEKLTLGLAARLAGVPQASFMDTLSARGIEIHYGPDELEKDLRTIEGLSPR